MHDLTPEEIIQQLNLVPHPEGGYYKETYRAAGIFQGYHLGTAIYFLMTENNHSNFHRIKQDELWFHHYGANVDIHSLADKKHHTYTLGMNKGVIHPYYLVPENTIFGSALSKGEKGFALVSCVVIPGFEFRDFELFTAGQLLSDFPGCEQIIKKLTP